MKLRQSEAHVDLSQVDLQFQPDQPPVLQDLSLQIRKKEFVSIVGRSGCGKSSLLQMIGGLLQPTRGEVKISGERVNAPREEITFVFQQPVLLEWRTVLENVLLPLELKRKLTEEDYARARERLRWVGLAEDAEKYPHECSGGMKSRVALARALLVDPQILLMDEPFAALDALTKEEMQVELASIRQQFEPTIIFITHDIQEAVFLSDRVIVLGGSPTHIIQELTIPFPHPRRPELKFDVQFAEMSKTLHEQLLGNEAGQR